MLDDHKPDTTFFPKMNTEPQLKQQFLPFRINEWHWEWNSGQIPLRHVILGATEKMLAMMDTTIASSTATVKSLFPLLFPSIESHSLPLEHRYEQITLVLVYMDVMLGIQFGLIGCCHPETN